MPWTTRLESSHRDASDSLTWRHAEFTRSPAGCCAMLTHACQENDGGGGFAPLARLRSTFLPAVGVGIALQGSSYLSTSAHRRCSSEFGSRCEEVVNMRRCCATTVNDSVIGITTFPFTVENWRRQQSNANVLNGFTFDVSSIYEFSTASLTRENWHG
jgi:hypothetical protein